MVVFDALIVVQVQLGDTELKELGGYADAAAAEVGVAEVERNAYVLKVAYTKDFEQMLGSGDFILQVFKQDFDAERLGEGFEVLDCGEGIFEGAGVPRLVLEAEVERNGAEGDLLGRFDGALDLVHGIDAAGLFGVDEVERRGDVAAPLGVGVEGLVERGTDVIRAKPVGDVANHRAVGIIEVVAGSEDFDDLSAAFVHGIKQTVIQPLLEKDVGRDTGLHQFLRYSSGVGVTCGERGSRPAPSARIGTR